MIFVSAVYRQKTFARLQQTRTDVQEKRLQPMIVLQMATEVRTYVIPVAPGRTLAMQWQILRRINVSLGLRLTMLVQTTRQMIIVPRDKIRKTHVRPTVMMLLVISVLAVIPKTVSTHVHLMVRVTTVAQEIWAWKMTAKHRTQISAQASRILLMTIPVQMALIQALGKTAEMTFVIPTQTSTLGVINALQARTQKIHALAILVTVWKMSVPAAGRMLTSALHLLTIIV